MWRTLSANEPRRCAERVICGNPQPRMWPAGTGPALSDRCFSRQICNRERLFRSRGSPRGGGDHFADSRFVGLTLEVVARFRPSESHDYAKPARSQTDRPSQLDCC